MLESAILTKIRRMKKRRKVKRMSIILYTAGGATNLMVSAFWF